jgi:hypothetical protein
MVVLTEVLLQISTMNVEVYNAFRKAGVADDVALAAARTMSESHTADLNDFTTKTDLSEAKVELIKWMDSPKRLLW